MKLCIKLWFPHQQLPNNVSQNFPLIICLCLSSNQLYADNFYECYYNYCHYLNHHGHLHLILMALIGGSEVHRVPYVTISRVQ
jgi:hypothetical protein